MNTNPSDQMHQRIAAAAYRRYEQRQGAPGDPLQDWLDAEKEVAAETETSGGSRSVYLRTLSTVLTECHTQLDELRENAQAASEVARHKLNEQLDLAASRYEAARGKLVEIREQADDAWVHLREGAENAAAELRNAIRSAAAVFK